MKLISSGWSLFSYRGGIQYYDDNSSFWIDLFISLFASAIGAYLGYRLAIRTQRKIETQKKKDEDYENECVLDFFILMLKEAQSYCKLQLVYWEEYIGLVENNLKDITLYPKISSNQILSRVVNYKLGDIVIPAMKRYGDVSKKFRELYLHLDQMKDVLEYSYNQMKTTQTRNYRIYDELSKIELEVGNDFLKLKLLSNYTDINDFLTSTLIHREKDKIIMNFQEFFISICDYCGEHLKSEPDERIVDILVTIIAQSSLALDLIKEIEGDTKLMVSRIRNNINNGKIIYSQLVDDLEMINK